MSEPVVTVNSLAKKYKIYPNPWGRIIEWGTLGQKSVHRDFWALRDVNFEVHKGQCLGIVGPNGAGKSTLLKIITGALWPTLGNVTVQGRVVSLLELGTGFHPDLTGLQNIYNSSSLLGIDPQYVKSKIDEIVDFSELGDFIFNPIKTYSSGMYVRLAFALFANLDPDVYIVDEALSVGDVFFQQKCFAKLQKMRDEGVTVLLVSHDATPITTFCDQAMIVDSGQVVTIGQPSAVWEEYQARQYARLTRKDQFSVRSNDSKLEYGTGRAKITQTCMCDATMIPSRSFHVGELANVTATVELEPEIQEVIVGIQIKNRFGTVLFGTNTNWLDYPLTDFRDGRGSVCFSFPVNLGIGAYTVSIAVAENKRFPEEIYSWVDNILEFEVVSEKPFTFGGDIFLPINVKQIEPQFVNKG